MEPEKILHHYDKEGKLRFSTFSNALRIDITYELVKNTTGGFNLQGIVGSGEHARVYMMPPDEYIMDILQSEEYSILPKGTKSPVFEYQVARLPEGKMGYVEKPLSKDGEYRVFEWHSGLDDIFFETAKENDCPPPAVHKKIAMEKKMELVDVLHHYNKEGQLRFTTFPNGLRIDITYELVKNTTDSSEEFLLQGTIDSGEYARVYIMPRDSYITAQLQLPPSQGRKLMFEYQIAKLPDGKMGYVEFAKIPDGEAGYAKRLITDTTKARTFKRHPGLDDIFFEIAYTEAAKKNGWPLGVHVKIDHVKIAEELKRQRPSTITAQACINQTCP